MIPWLVATAGSALLIALALFWLDGTAELAVYELVLLVAGTMLVRRIIWSTPLVELRRDRRQPQRTLKPPSLARVERLVVFAQSSGFDSEHRLVPLLRRLAADRLAGHHGVDMVRRPDLARDMLGDPAWEALRPDRPADSSRDRPGPPLSDLEHLVDAVERL